MKCQILFYKIIAVKCHFLSNELLPINCQKCLWSNSSVVLEIDTVKCQALFKFSSRHARTWFSFFFLLPFTISHTFLSKCIYNTYVLYLCCWRRVSFSKPWLSSYGYSKEMPSLILWNCSVEMPSTILWNVKTDIIYTKIWMAQTHLWVSRKLGKFSYFIMKLYDVCTH